MPFTELLEYARNISRYTVPPTYREAPPNPKAATIDDRKGDAAPAVNGTGDAVAEAREVNAIANGAISEGGKEKTGVGVSSLDQGEVKWLNEYEQILFVPWPKEEVIKRGALGQIQMMLEQGVDPEATGAAEEVARKIEAEGGERDVQMGEGPTEAVGVAGVVGQQRENDGQTMVEERRREEKPKVFKGLDLDEDSDED